jgi:hypothetical protein
MKRTKAALFLALCTLLPIGAQASDLSYSWVEADYLDAGRNTDGFGLRGSLQFGQTGLYGLASYIDVETDTVFGEFDGQAWELGLGYAHGLAGNTDLIGELAHSDGEGFDSLRGSVGVRSGFTPKLEGVLKANYRDYDCGGCDDGDYTGTAGLQYKFTPAFGLVGEVEFGGGEDTWLLGARASF